MIRLELPALPPSSNHAYINNGFGGRTLSAAGKKFLITTKAHLAQQYPREMMLFKPNLPYIVVARFFFEHLENTGFATGKAQNRYKRVDGSNRLKLLEDALADAGGIDDSQFLSTTPHKVQGTPERTLVWVWSLAEESGPVYDALRSLS